MERPEAARLGLSRYNTGRPCKNGHTDDRYTVSGICIGCIKKYNEKFKRPKNDAAPLIRQHWTRDLGLVSGEVWAHPDDWEVLAPLAQAMLEAREKTYSESRIPEIEARRAAIIGGADPEALARAIKAGGMCRHGVAAGSHCGFCR